MNDPRVEQALTDQLLVQIKQSGFANLFLITVVGSFIGWNLSDHSIVWWIVPGYLITIVRFPLLSYFQRKLTHASSNRILGLIILIALGLSGMHWGMVAFLYLDIEDPQLFIFIVFAILGVVCASLASLTIRPLVWFVFTISAFGLTLLKLVLLGNWGLVAMGSGLTVFLTIVGRSLGERIKLSITQDFRNAQLLEEVSIAKEEADSANLAKSLFMAATSHDLRQPLHAQSLLLDSLIRQTNEPSKKILVDKIVKSNDALISLFDSLLEVSQLDAGTITVHKSSFLIHDLCSQIVDEFLELANKKNIQLEFYGDHNVVESDPVLLSRVIRNLLSNAIKFTESGSVIIKFEQPTNVVELTVTDTGIGIPEEHHEHIFNEYTQLGNATRDRSKGIGLGLAVVKRLCNLLEHSITIESQPGSGTEFKVFLPIGYDEVQSSSFEENTLQDLGDINIVLLDDEVSILEAMERLLEDWNCPTRAFTNCTDALNYLDKSDFKPDLILSDYRLAENLSGIDAIQQLRDSIERQVPAILISGDTDPALLDKLEKEDFFLLHKPVKPSKLRRVMSMVLNPEPT